MITDIEMEAMNLFIREISNRPGLEGEYSALIAMRDMLADLDIDRFYNASDEEKTAFVKQFSSGLISENTAEEKEQTRWICVYKDTVCRHADVDNLVNIELPADWLYKVLRAEGEEDIEAWFGEYTADSTEAIARKALEDGVILGCDDEYVMNSILFRKENPELVVAAEKVEEFLDSFNDHEEIPDELGFEFKGTFIKDPFYDESMRFEVDPFVYYGADNMNSYLEKAKHLMSKDCDKTLDDVIRTCEKVSKKQVVQRDNVEKSSERDL